MEKQKDAAVTLADHVVKVQYEDIPPEAVEATKKDILDTIGCIWAGTSAPGVREVVELVKDWGGKEESTIFGYGGKVPSIHAALANGTAGHARDYDDNHDLAQTHCGVCVVPAALATAEQKGGISGKDLIVAVTLGLDLDGRIPLAVSIRQQNGWHYTPVFGCFSAAATAGKLLKLNREQMVNAFGIAYSQAAGTLQVSIDGALTKRLQAGLGARAGILSALLAKKGFTGTINSFEGKYGLFNLYFQGDYDIKLLIEKLGKTFDGVNLAFKPYPCCRDLHTSIDATLALVNENAITSDQIESVTLGVNSFDFDHWCQPIEVKHNPRNIIDAQFSIPYVVAVAIIDKRVVLDSFTETAIKRPEILGMTKKIKSVIDPEIERKQVGSITPPAKVEIRTKDGKVFSKQVDIAKGHPKNPMTREEFLGKFRDCAGHAVKVIPKQNIENVIEMVMNLEKIENIDRIVQLLA
jgi:2-methylcitrate dehydratase PrpD